MIRLPQDGVLYHGSYTEVSRIDLSQCRSGLDFGKGFYVTSSLKQAVSYIPASVRKAKRRGVLADDFSESDGRVSVYQLQPDPNLGSDLSRIILPIKTNLDHLPKEL